MRTTFFGLTVRVAAAILLIATSTAEAAPQPKPAGNPTTAPDAYVEPALPAFPGAEGYGAMSVGGRGGGVIKVTNLNASGPGSLAEACAAEGPRIVVFDVSGVIRMPSGGKGAGKLLIKHPHITIAGQTAPGGGITLEGYLSTQGMSDIHDVTIRFMRIRPRAGKGNNRTFEFNGGASGVEHRKLIVDHCSMSWGADDCGSFCVVNNITAQWCNFEESDIHLEGGDEPHNFGAMFGPYGHGQATMHHCLFAHHHDRSPLTGADPLDYRNNVLYNVATGLITHPFRMNHRSPGKKFDINMVANYCKSGPGAIVGPRLYRPPYTLTTPSIGPVQSAEAYVQGNYHDWRGGFVHSAAAVERPFDTPPVTCQPADEAYQLVLAAGGCLPRDAVSKRTIHEVRTGTGEWGRHEPDGGLMEGLTPGKPRPDADNDGMPDDWETAHGLNSNDPADAAKIVPPGASKGDRHAGYSYVEYYINELADDLVADAIVNWRLADEPTKASDFGPANRLLTPLLPAAEIVAAIKEQSNAVVKAAAGDKYAYTRTDKAWYAIQMLSRMGRDPKAGDPSPCVQPLIEVLSGDDTRSVVFAVYGLGAIGPSAKAAVPALIKVLERDYAVPNLKWNFCPNGWAAWALGRIGPDARDAVPALARALTGKDIWAHEQAAWALSRMGPAAEPAVDALVAQLNSQSLTMRTLSAGAISNIGKPAVQPLTVLLERCKFPASCAEAAGLIGPAAAPVVPPLMKLAANEDPAIRSAASVALCRINPQAGGNADLICERIADKDAMVRYNVIEAVGRCGPAAINCKPALVKALGDANESVRGAAADALGAMGAVDALVKAFAAEHADVRARAARAGGRARPDATTLKALPELLTDKIASVRFEAAVSLARLTRGEPGAKLRQALNDDDYMVRAAARAAIGSRYK